MFCSFIYVIMFFRSIVCPLALLYTSISYDPMFHHLQEQFKSLPREEANKYKHDLHIKNSISCALKFLQLEKSLETYRGKLLKYQKLIHILLRCLKTRKTCNEEMNTGLESNILPSQDPRQTISLTGGTRLVKTYKSLWRYHWWYFKLVTSLNGCVCLNLTLYLCFNCYK